MEPSPHPSSEESHPGTHTSFAAHPIDQPSLKTSPNHVIIASHQVHHPSEVMPPLFYEEDFPPLSRSGHTPSPSPLHSPTSTPSFADPSLQTSLDIFTDRTPLSPSVLPLDSIRFQNVTIRRRSKKPPSSTSDSTPQTLPYTPLSTRLKFVARNSLSSPLRALRAKSPGSSGS